MLSRSENVALIGFITFVALLCYARACDMDQTHFGCRIDNGSCSCAHGCKSEFRYTSMRDCQNALKGRATNICSRRPCENGFCTQISVSPGFKCTCHPGYYGNKCQRKCPTPGTAEHAMATNIGTSCVII